MYSIKCKATAEIVVKKSKFIANLFPVQSEEEAKSIIKEISKKFHDARHNCYTYIIENGNIEKASDNGEPAGTAGAPMLDILKNKGLSNILAIVTRYFGGILLGTGGLVKAYSDSLLKALENTEVVELRKGNRYKLTVNYSDVRNLEYNIEKYNAKIIKSNYNEIVDMIIDSTDDDMENIKNNVDIKKIELIEHNIYI